MAIGKKVKEFFTKPKKAEEQENKEREELQSVQYQIDSTEKQKIVGMVKARVKEFEGSRTEFMFIREKSIKQYEGIKEETNVPWPGHSNISTMVTTVACDLLHAKLFPMVWNESSITWEGVEEHDKEIATVNKEVMSFVVSTDMKMQNTVDDIVHCLVVDGTVAIKKHWEVYWKWVTRKIPDGVEMFVTQGGALETKKKFKIQYDYIRRERCRLEIRPLEMVYLPFNADSNRPNWEDTADIIDERWYTIADLRELQQQGAIDDSVNLEDIKVKMAQSIDEFKGTTKVRMRAEGTTAPNPIENDVAMENYKLKCYEAELMYDINKDKIREKNVFLVIDKLDMYLSGKPMHAVSRVGRSSWIIRPFLRRPGRVYGKGTPELVRHLHDELDAIHNQRIDAGNMLIAPFFFYRSASGVKPRRIVAGPATGIPLDDPDRDVKFPTFPGYGLQISFQEEALVMELIERLTYLTPAMLGKETAQRPTARGTLAVIQQGESKFGLIGKRVQAVVCDLLTDVRQKYEENMPPEAWERIMGREKLREWPSPEAMIGMYEAKMQLDITAMDLDAERALAGMVYQTMAFDPIVMQNPAFAWEVRADWLKALRRTPVEKYIGPRPDTQFDQKDADDIFTMLEQEMQNVPLGDPSTLLPRLLELRRSPRYEKFTPEAKTLFNDYIRKLKTGYIDKTMKNMEMYGNLGTQTADGGMAGAAQAPGMGGLMPQGAGRPGGGAFPARRSAGPPGGGSPAQ